MFELILIFVDKDKKLSYLREYGCMIIVKLNFYEIKQMYWLIFEILKKFGCFFEEIMKICRKKVEEFYFKVGIIIMILFFIR